MPGLLPDAARIVATGGRNIQASTADALRKSLNDLGKGGASQPAKGRQRALSQREMPMAIAGKGSCRGHFSDRNFIASALADLIVVTPDATERHWIYEALGDVGGEVARATINRCFTK
jgi:hypothetical protein